MKGRLLISLYLGFAFASALMGMQRFDVQPSQEERNNQLFDAVLRNNSPAIWSLIRAGADVNARNEFGSTPFMLLQVDKLEWVFNECIIAGARFDLRDNDGNNALIRAAKRGEVVKCKLIISAQSKRNAKKAMPALLLLNRLKNEGNEGARLLYRQFKSLLLPYFDLVISLDDLKNMRDNAGKHAYDYLPLYSLVPKSELKVLRSRIFYAYRQLAQARCHTIDRFGIILLGLWGAGNCISYFCNPSYKNIISSGPALFYFFGSLGYIMVLNRIKNN